MTDGASAPRAGAPVIDSIRVTPLRHPLRTPYRWSQGTETHFHTLLIEVRSGDLTGIGECTAAPDPQATGMIVRRVAEGLTGQDPWHHAGLLAAAWKKHWTVWGCVVPRQFAQVASGLEMACLDLCGKLAGRPVWDLLGGAVRDSVGYFHFLQGETPEELAEDARDAVARSMPVLYLKVGMGEARDIASVQAVRAAVPNTRLRLDANEGWPVEVALRMLRRIAEYDIEYVEQPTPATSTEALARLTARSPIPIGADQAVFSISDAHRVVANGGADMLAVGPREAGGLRATRHVAALAEGGGMTLCIHSSMTTGITTAAEHHVARTIPNLDDANQIMWQLLERDIVAAPDLTPVAGHLALPAVPGLGITLDPRAVDAARA
ncbi:mandelate racemase/muconate lactonizing enzyme family protein [Sulfitobacter mediterraneus]|jgi:L-alanine-DL-glutamate epimerase-like enolase superfamily enzyme|uniref:mandelate racemase/muconate lactonizing enzyme family protein n=1 Tax=Sulfitobacter TaxID=60136 RepID=UPI001931810A|nr:MULTISPECIES: mandelate racemase/muconate lactonizing enzyme family protein [Sulfitobacter]MBM1634334.1 mandelate racemase/muconate lactonizing enzyme family protein [Sulfitobacter mediterraneus]MBM1642151.1 mandelate racemase/muconate lactonizing enzyme family protein [Sulfitobacter mediterraneus]MBM1646200.1 mandelate racemase/muconate lactonizing enzyme family protein [Sulfitobacter mediterraneus]MBM1650246.1 mandelate racemase/muconate lactonizing enzyme family protein [Sulfitobacter med